MRMRWMTNSNIPGECICPSCPCLWPPMTIIIKYVERSYRAADNNAFIRCQLDKNAMV